MHRFSISLNPTKRIEHPKLPWGMLSHVHASMQWYISIVLICFVDATDIAPVLMDGCKKCCGNQSAARTLDGTDSHNGTRQWPTPKCWEIMSAHLLTRVSLSCLFGGCRLSHPNTIVFPRRCFKQVPEQADAAEATRWWDWMPLGLPANFFKAKKLGSREWIPQRQYFITLWFLIVSLLRSWPLPMSRSSRKTDQDLGWLDRTQEWIWRWTTFR